MKLTRPIGAILVLSTLALIFLFWLIYFGPKLDSSSFRHLSTLNALLNTCTTIALVTGVYWIRHRQIDKHKRAMITAFCTSTAFLVSYIVYHLFHGDTKFLGEGLIRPVYFSILISHIGLSVVALPIILITFYFGLSRSIEAHKKLARWTFPIWMYVSVSGVAVYLLLRVYNP